MKKSPTSVYILGVAMFLLSGLTLFRLTAVRTEDPAANTPLGMVQATASVSSPAEVLVQRVKQHMRGLTYTPEGLCSFSSGDRLLHDHAEVEAFSELVISRETQSLSHQAITDIFNAGLGSNVILADQAHILDEANGYLLVEIYGLECLPGSHNGPVPTVYVFSRRASELTGSARYWAVGGGPLSRVQWLEDRWAALLNIVHDGAPPIYTLIQVRQGLNGWEQADVSRVPNGPLLDWAYFSETPALTFRSGYRTLLISSRSGSGYRGSGLSYFFVSSGGLGQFHSGPPCAFGNRLSSLKPIPVCSIDCDPGPITFRHAFYFGELTFAWDGQEYLLTTVSPYYVQVLLSDGSTMQDTPPTAEDLATINHLRTENWRDYCVSSNDTSNSPF